MACPCSYTRGSSLLFLVTMEPVNLLAAITQILPDEPLAIGQLLRCLHPIT